MTPPGIMTMPQLANCFPKTHHIFLFKWTHEDDNEDLSIVNISDVIEDAISDTWGICTQTGHDCFYFRYCRKIVSKCGYNDRYCRKCYLAYIFPVDKLTEIIRRVISINKKYNLKLECNTPEAYELFRGYVMK